MKTQAEILEEAKALIKPMKNWTQGYYAHDSNGKNVTPDDPKATKFCAIGAVYRAGVANGLFPNGETARAEKTLNRVAADRYSVPGIASLNDIGDRRTAHDKIMRVFDRAIALARETV